MLIAFDGTTLTPGRTGVGYYTEHLLQHLAREVITTGDEIVVVSNKPIDTQAPLPPHVRVHANNSYVEVLAGMGAIGVAAMAWLMLAALRSGTRSLIDVSDARLPIVAASFAACAAIAVHALVDSFLTFTPTYAVFAIAAGVLFSAHSSIRGETC